MDPCTILTRVQLIRDLQALTYPSDPAICSLTVTLCFINKLINTFRSHFQGFVIFILFVPLRPDIRKEWRAIVGSVGSPVQDVNYLKTDTASTIVSKRSSSKKRKHMSRQDSMLDRCIQS